jgi:Glyoxalase-like domain
MQHDPGARRGSSLGHYHSMRLDHLSYAAGPEGLASCVQRLGSHLGAGFSDGGIHPRFGTRNFVLALKNGIYLEAVEALDHPASEKAPFGRSVRQRGEAGGGWLNWVVGVSDLPAIEVQLGRPAAAGHRVRPDGYDLRWRQIGITDTESERQLPWFIHWDSDKAEHPAALGSTVNLERIDIAGDRAFVMDHLGERATVALESLKIKWLDMSEYNGESGIVRVHFTTPLGVVTID